MYLKKQIIFKSRPICIGLLLFFKCYTAQVNLIENPSFEDTLQIPTNGSQFYKCKNWIVAFATPDYFSTLSPATNTTFASCPVSIPLSGVGIQFAHHGNFYAGLANIDYYSAGVGYPKFSNYFELIGGYLKSALIKNHVYDFKMFYNNTEISKYINNNLSAYFSVNQFSLNIGTYNPLSQIWYDTNINYINPQINNDTTQYLNSDTISWNELKGCFIADGGERYITVGNFRDNKFQKYKQLNTSFVSSCNGSLGNFSYLFIDDLSLYDIGYYSGAAKAKKDTVICNGVSYTIGNNAKDSASIMWWPPTALSCTNCLNPVASPTVTTKYYVQKTLGCISSKDSITITVYTPTATANAGKSATLCVNDNLQLGTNDVTTYSTYTWQPTQNLNCYYCPQPMLTAKSSITYTLNRKECSSITTSTVDIYLDNCELILPQGISPNGDGINDVLAINIPFAQSATLRVFNRWGNELYVTESSSGQAERSRSLVWDGKAHKGLVLNKGGLVPAGTYFYLVEVTQADGTKKVYKEFVQVVY